MSPVGAAPIRHLGGAVLLSVLAHGLSADPLAKRYGARLAPPSEAAAPAELPGVPERRLIRRTPAAGQP